MIRLVVYLLVLALIAFGVAWLADRPGSIAIDWQGWQIETSILVAASALLALLAATILVWTLLRLIFRSPDLIAFSWRARRRNRGWAAVTRGLVAVGSGDALGARRAANDAERLLGQEPLARLLAAQAAQLAGDRDGAEAAFRAMTETPSTRLLGLRGLHVEARRRGDAAAALLSAEEAARHEPGLAWAADAVIEARCLNGDFAGALATLEREAAHGGLERAAHRRRRAVLLAAQAQALELSDPSTAREKAVEATRLAPTLVPAAEVAGRLLGAAGDARKAAKIIEAAYAATPHPDLADAFLHLRPGDSSRERLKRIRTLTARMPAHPESAMVLARAALDAQDFDVARTSLAPLLGEPTQRACLLDGGAGSGRAWRCRQGPRMDGAGGARRARSGLGGGWHRRGALGAGLAGDRQARRLRVEAAARRRHHADAGERGRAGEGGDRRRHRGAAGGRGRGGAREDVGAAGGGPHAGGAGAEPRPRGRGEGTGEGRGRARGPGLARSVAGGGHAASAG